MGKPIGDKGLELIKSFEGCYLNAYKDIVGVWTIGYGHTGKVDGKAIKTGMKITKEKASELLRADVQKHADYVDNGNYCPVTKKLNANQRDALISFCFNVGPGNLKKLCTGRSIKEISTAILQYDHAGGRVVAGLTKRRKAEKALFDAAVKKTTTTTATKKYNYPNKTYKTYTQKLFRQDLQIYFGCKSTTGNFTQELLGKTITLSKKTNATKGIVKFVQKYLKGLGYYDGTFTKVFDANTEKAVKKYQKSFGGVADGEITAKKKTWEKLLK